MADFRALDSAKIGSIIDNEFDFGSIEELLFSIHQGFLRVVFSIGSKELGLLHHSQLTSLLIFLGQGHVRDETTPTLCIWSQFVAWIATCEDSMSGV